MGLKKRRRKLKMGDKAGAATIVTAVGMKAAEEAELIVQTAEWVMTDYALVISMIGGLFFIAEKFVNIRAKIKENKSK